MQASEAFPFDDAAREELHLRRIDLRGWRRADGLFEVEARLVDRKPFDFQPPGSDAALVPADEPIHDFTVRVIFDQDMVVRAVRSQGHALPYGDCARGGDSLQALVGLRMSAGWNGEVRKRLPNSETCTHVKELMAQIATVAFQSTVQRRLHQLDAVDAHGKPLKIDTCYAYAASREQVLHRWPAFHRPPPSKE
jgi:hypothetical protein